LKKYATKLRIKNIKKAAPNFFSKQDRKTFKSSYLQAHRHIDTLCPKNKNHRLKVTTIAGRSTYYCPEEQK
jgi:formamidopyrimidine-DNA glycosylase